MYYLNNSTRFHLQLAVQRRLLVGRSDGAATTRAIAFKRRRRTLVHISRSVTDDRNTDENGDTVGPTRTRSAAAVSVDEQYSVINPTQLVDDLLEYTESLMTTSTSQGGIQHNNKATANTTMPKHHIIAFSGGIDSSVATALISLVQQRSLPKDNVTAVLGKSPALPLEQERLAEQVATHLGVSFKIIRTTEGDDELYLRNDGRACLACKTHLYTCLNSIAEHYRNGIDNHVSNKILQHRLYNGTNADDLKDPTRLGLIAAQNYSVSSPLQYTPKALVRIAGKHLGLPNWDCAASPCLRSRLALGVPATAKHLQLMEKAERFVREQLQLLPFHNLRVRLLTGNRAMIEVDPELISQVRELIVSSAWRTLFLETLAFQSVDVRPFQTGSVATAPKATSYT